MAYGRFPAQQRSQLPTLAAGIGFGQDAVLVLSGKTTTQSAVVLGIGYYLLGALG